MAITADTTYVVSYHAPRGNYAVTDQQFLTAGVDNPPLHALRNGDDGGNGVYGYGAERHVPERRLPLRGLLGRRRRRDRTPGPDTTAPTITGRLPPPDADGVAAPRRT